MPTPFSDFYQSLDVDPAKRGKQFEIFVKWFLKADPEWSTQVDQVWLWNEYPERWGRDCGIDLVFLHKNGEIWAVQAKCYFPDQRITKNDVDKFLSESNRKAIHRRMLIATTDLLSDNARQVCEAQEKPVIHFLLSDFERAELEYPSNLNALTQAKHKTRPEPRDYQKEAIAAVVQGLQAADRGQLIMACGTGKTYVTLWIKEGLAAQRSLVLVPSLGLLSQILREWTFAAATSFEVLCVCSDQTVIGKKGEDEAIHTVADLAFPVTTDVGDVKCFLSGAGNRVIFSTYQSSSVIALAQEDTAIPAFDLVVADEAHRCAGKVGSDFATVLDGVRVRSNKRLYSTATPRTYSGNVKKAAEDRGVEVIGMDDTILFGDVLYALPFGKAIAKGLLTDYRVVIIGVDNPTIAQWIANRKLVQTNTGIKTDTGSLATQIGVLKAIKDYDLRRVISFHNRVNQAKAFTTDIRQIMEWVGDKYRPSGTLLTDFVSGEMYAYQRKKILDKLRSLAADERRVLSNARCLAEGVDVPSLDGVAFIDPRSSQVDIIQAVGRAIRLSPDKKAGTVVMPVFITPEQNAEDALKSSNFKPIWDVLRALKAHDDVLAAELDQIRTAFGKKPDTGVGALRKITIDLPSTVDADFGGALRTYLVEQVTESWNFWFGLLETFVEREGRSDVPQNYKTADGYKLGSWVSEQRKPKNKDRMPLERKARLEALPGWTWDSLGAKWEIGFRRLKEFADREGCCNVSRFYNTSDGCHLGNWVHTQRSKKDTMIPERKTRLEALRGWSWDPNAEQWEKGFLRLKEYADREERSKVHQNYKTADGYPLGKWVQTQRSNKDTLPQECKTRLEALRGWSWDPNAEQWEIGFRHLKEFADRKGNCDVPQNHKTAGGYKLGSWVSEQRKPKKRGRMSLEHKARLEALPGWIWDSLEAKWETGFRHLKEFADKEGHCKVPKRHRTTKGYSLGYWVQTQRNNKDTPQERKTRLEALRGWSWRVEST